MRKYNINILRKFNFLAKRMHFSFSHICSSFWKCHFCLVTYCLHMLCSLLKKQKQITKYVLVIIWWMFVLFYVALHRLFQGHCVCVSSSFCVCAWMDVYFKIKQRFLLCFWNKFSIIIIVLWFILYFTLSIFVLFIIISVLCFPFI